MFTNFHINIRLICKEEEGKGRNQSKENEETKKKRIKNKKIEK